ncbi:MAG: DNA-directed RNA polymerase subunit omega [Terriglobia bacterium]
MELPQGIDSKFRYILVAAKRSHQLYGGAKPRVQSGTQKIIVVAQREVCSGLVPFTTFDGDGNSLNNAAKLKAA